MSKVWIVREKWRIPDGRLEKAEMEETEVVEKDIDGFIEELKGISEKWYVEGIFKEISEVMEEDIGDEVDRSMKRIRLEQLLKSQRDVHIGPYRSYGEDEITVKEIGDLCRMLRDLKGYKLVVWMPNEPKYVVYGPPMSCYWEVYGVPVKTVRIRI